MSDCQTAIQEALSRVQSLEKVARCIDDLGAAIQKSTTESTLDFTKINGLCSTALKHLRTTRCHKQEALQLELQGSLNYIEEKCHPEPPSLLMYV